MDDREQKIEQLKKYFAARNDVVMAFLFGSQAKGTRYIHARSDWDIGVYFQPLTDRVEWENSEREYPAEHEIWGDLVSLLKSDDVDLLVLNRTPASVVETAMHGVALVIKDLSLYFTLMRILSSAAEEYRNFVNDYYAISQRSHSLTARDREDFIRTIDFLEEQMRLYPVYQKFTQGEFDQEPRKRNEIERWLENIMNAIIDISKLKLASQKRLIPAAYRDMVRRAIAEFGCPEELYNRIDQWVILRNVLAHEYLDIKWKRLFDFAHTSEPYIHDFVQAAKRFLEQ